MSYEWKCRCTVPGKAGERCKTCPLSEDTTWHLGVPPIVIDCKLADFCVPLGEAEDEPRLRRELAFLTKSEMQEIQQTLSRWRTLRHPETFVPPGASQILAVLMPYCDFLREAGLMVAKLLDALEAAEKEIAKYKEVLKDYSCYSCVDCGRGECISCGFSTNTKPRRRFWTRCTQEPKKKF